MCTALRPFRLKDSLRSNANTYGSRPGKPARIGGPRKSGSPRGTGPSRCAWAHGFGFLCDEHSRLASRQPRPRTYLVHDTHRRSTAGSHLRASATHVYRCRAVGVLESVGIEAVHALQWRGNYGHRLASSPGCSASAPEVGANPAFQPGMNDRTPSPFEHVSPWLTAREGAPYARCGVKRLYEAVRNGQLRAVRLGGRRELRFRREWLDEWLENTTVMVPIDH
jgi:excisionase family DNA binding protein